MAEVNPGPTRYRPVRFRLSLRALMVVVLIIGGWLGWIVSRATLQRDVVASIRRTGGRVDYDCDWRYGRPKRAIWAPRWLVDALGIDFFSTVSGVNVFGSQEAADQMAEQLAVLGQLDAMTFNGSGLTDEGLAHLKGLNVRMLYLEGTNVTDAGLATLRDMKDLEALDLFNTGVGDAGIAHLVNLPRLRWLSLAQTRIGDPALTHLERLAGLRTLHLFGTKVGDVGAVHLKPLTNLKTLSLDRTRVTAQGLAKLRAALPGTAISSSPGSPRN